MESCHSEPTIGMIIIKEFKRGISDSLSFEIPLRRRRIGATRLRSFENLNCDTTSASLHKLIHGFSYKLLLLPRDIGDY